MENHRARQHRRYLMGGAIGLAVGTMPMAAHAAAIYPYAYASNMITGLLLSGGMPSKPAATNTETLSDGAEYGSMPLTGGQGSAAINAAATLPQAYSGPGPAPASTFSPVGIGNFTGVRADTAIGANTGSGSSVSNVAEGYGNLLGNSNGQDSAAITFNYTGTGSKLTISFTDAVALNAVTTAIGGGSAQASVQDTFQINGDGNSAFYSPFNTPDGMQGVGSADGVGSNPTAFTNSYIFTTPFKLAAGSEYSITLNSLSRVVITPSIPVPEPGSLVVFGTGLIGLGAVLRRKKSQPQV